MQVQQEFMGREWRIALSTGSHLEMRRIPSFCGFYLASAAAAIRSAEAELQLTAKRIANSTATVTTARFSSRRRPTSTLMTA